MKLPDYLPDFPPVPKGYSHWVYKGTGYLSTARVRYANWAGISKIWGVASRQGYTPGHKNVHYLEGVKLEAPIDAPNVRIRLDAPMAGPAIVELLARVLKKAGATVSREDASGGFAYEKATSLKGLKIHFDRPTWVREEEAERWNKK